MMPSRPNGSSRAILRPHEARALRAAVGFVSAGKSDGVPGQVIEALESAFLKLNEAPAQAVWIAFSRMELMVLWDAIGNGAEGVLQPFSGVRSGQRAAFRNAANRIADAFGFGPKF